MGPRTHRSAKSASPGEGAANEVLSFDIESKKTVTVTGGVKSWSLSADRKKILVAGPGTLGVLDSGAGEGASPKKVDIGSATITVNPQQEWKQILEESWRITRDFFYDPGMHGVDWNAIHAKYQGLLPLVGDRNDLADLQEAMVSELGTGHAYIGNPAPYGGRGSGIGYLGADLEPAGNAVKITKLFGGDPFSVGSRSPLLEPGLNVKVGDYILAVNGQPVRADQEFSALTVGLQGQTVALTINDKPSAEGSRIVRIKLLGSDDSLRYQDWVASRTAYVKEHGGPNFGYVHVPDMGDSGVVGFVKGQAVNSRSEAVVYDFRYNGGGFVSSMILDNIRTKPVYWFKPRAGNPWTREDWSSIGYSAALCNEYNFSDGELVIETWKKMGLGPVVGKTTGGGEVGSGGGYTLIDGGSIYVPNYAAYTDGKWIIEGEGARPDFDVDEDPASVLAGKDPQLDKAIELLKAKIAQKQPTVPVPPTYTKKK